MTAEGHLVLNLPGHALTGKGVVREPAGEQSRGEARLQTHPTPIPGSNHRIFGSPMVQGLMPQQKRIIRFHQFLESPGIRQIRHHFRAIFESGHHNKAIRPGNESRRDNRRLGHLSIPLAQDFYLKYLVQPGDTSIPFTGPAWNRTRRCLQPSLLASAISSGERSIPMSGNFETPNCGRAEVADGTGKRQAHTIPPVCKPAMFANWSSMAQRWWSSVEASTSGSR